MCRPELFDGGLDQVPRMRPCRAHAAIVASWPKVSESDYDDYIYHVALRDLELALALVRLARMLAARRKSARA
jgi:hypothetical protein